MEVAACREPSLLGRKRAFGARDQAFDAKREVCIFTAVGKMAVTESALKVLRQRFKSELVAVRGLHDKAKKIVKASPPSVIKSRKIKASPSPVIKRIRKVTHGERELVKAGLENLVLSELPRRIRDLLEKQSHAVRDGYMEMDIDDFEDEAILELRKQLHEFLPELRQEHKRMAGEEGEDVDIVGGVSPLAAIVLAPLPLAEEDDEYVDICGDASPAKNPGDDETISGTPCSSSSSSSDSSRAERDATLLIASAKESVARCRAREKARQEVLQMERAPKHMTTQTIHPALLKSLHIVEYDYHRLIPYTVLPQLGLFLKADDDQEQDLEEGETPVDLEEGEIHDDLEEGEIRF